VQNRHFPMAVRERDYGSKVLAGSAARAYGKTDLGFASDAGYSQPATARSRAAYKGGRS
jgi:hypothetical protein